MNNTAACPASGTLPSYCQKPFTGQTDSRPLVATPEFDLPAGNVSTEDIHGYLTQGAQTKIFANFMLGYCTDSTTTYCNNNVQPGYTSDDPNTVAAQATDLVNRHFDGAILSWDGAGTTADAATLLFQQWADQNACTGNDCSFSYLIMYNGASMAYNVASTGIPGTSGQSCSATTGAAYETCIVAHMQNDMCYMNGMHWGNPAYLKVNGQPVLQIFPQEDVIPATGPAPSWEDAWAQIEAWNENLPQNCAIAPYNAENGVPLVVFENGDGFTHQDSSGAFYWIEPAGIDPATDQFVYNISPQTVGGTLDNFFATAQLYTGQLVFSDAFKGFNSVQSTWGTNRIMDQQCGQTWIESLTESNNYYPGSAVPFLHVSTWNDYNEGTEIETGIDNCYTMSAGISGSTLNWTLSTANSAASLSTVSHIEIYDSADGQNLTLLATQPAAQNGSWDLSTLPSGTHILFVRMVGKNSILNRISTGISYEN